MALRPRGRPKGSKNRVVVPSHTPSEQKFNRIPLIKDIWEKVKQDYPKGGFLLENSVDVALAF
jgi:hypothetical protein